MSDIYLSQHGMEVSKDGGRLVIKSKDGQVKYLPLSYADCLIVTASVQITYAAIMAVLANNGSIIYIDNNGDVYPCGAVKLNRKTKICTIYESFDIESYNKSGGLCLAFN